MSRKIAFLSAHNHPQTDSTLEVLRKYFREYEIIKVNIVSELRSDKLAMLLNTLYTLKDYGWEILKGKREFKKIFFRTEYLFKKIGRIVEKKLDGEDILFTFQIGSVFDMHFRDVPHFVYTDHTHLNNLEYPAFDKDTLLPRKMIDLEKELYKNASLVFTYSSNVTRSLLENYNCPGEKIKCVCVGSNITSNNGVVLNNNDFANKNILFVGIDWERKGGPELVRAFREIRKSHPEATLTIVGASPEIKEDNINVVGRVKVDELTKYYSTASIFCLPTKIEPFGIVYIEAMLKKLPVIASNIGAIPDFVTEETGIRINPESIGELIEALDTLLSNPDKCKRLGERGHDLVKSQYTWDSVGMRFKENIMKVLSQ